jgi:ribonuclease HI
MSDTCVINTDGGSRGNPGPAAFGYVIRFDGKPPLREKGYLGTATNNVAEYTGVLRALQHALELGVKHVTLLSDSELMVKQMNGVYQVRNANILPLYRQVKALLPHFTKVIFKHVPREENSDADALCNEAMDEEARGVVKPLREFKLPVPASSANPSFEGKTETAAARQATDVGCPETLNDRAVAWLAEVQRQWAAGRSVPDAASVWRRLWEIVKDECPDK